MAIDAGVISGILEPVREKVEFDESVVLPWLALLLRGR
jgi:hypothetical protein